MPPKSKPTSSHSAQPAENASAETLKTQTAASGSGMKSVENHGPTRKPQSAHTDEKPKNTAGPNPAPVSSHSSKSNEKA